ncbi:MAG TPA: DUF6600 domain-containing protein [Pyrinomonadaceae bacterium]|jgi:hypothetical protein
MRAAQKVLRAVFLVLPFLFAGNVFAETADDSVPEVTARVARISFLRGDVQIRRADSDEWERAAQNLPIVEGDEITTGANARLEIQFNSQTYLRLSETSYLKIVKLKDEGIAVSLPQGNLSLRLLEFDKNRAYFEIDAPKTTVSVQKKGMYRVDAGDDRAAELRVSVTDEGEARIYSETSGFTLRNGRSAKIVLEGSYAGEWETADASRYADDFDSWALQRDAVIAKRLREARYDEYYDRDIYGAEDLSEYGEWIHTRKYGYVWRPYKNSVSTYANWSPYRYGHWRWVPPYGWTWINDEPWGWATYHHGRWVYVDRDWVWTPYGQHRSRRSWWQPALVVLVTLSNNVCWYPLPYSYAHYDYNRHYRRHHRNNTTIINNNTTVIVNNTVPVQNQPVLPVEETLPGKGKKLIFPRTTQEAVPLNGVVAVNTSEFGRDRKGFVTAPVEIARTAITKTPEIIETAPILPTFKELNGKVSDEIQTAPPKIAKLEKQIRTGATVRQSDGSMDEELRRSRIFGNRSPVQIKPVENETRIEEGKDNERRRTGAVVRAEMSDDKPDTKRKKIDVFTQQDDSRNNSEDRKTPNRDKPRIERPRRDSDEVKQPDYTPPIEKREKIRLEPPAESPRKQEPKQRDPERQPPPQRDEPIQQPPPKREDPPQKSEPKENRKSDPPVERTKDSKDNK